MVTPFDRGLSPPFFATLRSGAGASILATCRRANLDVRLRDDYLNAYAGGRSIARIVWRNGTSEVEIHRKYVPEGAFDGAPRTTRGDYVAFPVTAELAAQCVDELSEVVRTSEAHAGIEEVCEEQLLRDNAGGGPFTAIDRQVGLPGTKRYVDVVGVLAGPTPSVVLVEIKRDLDNRIQKVPAQVARYLECFAPSGGRRDDVARSLRLVASQLRELGFAAPEPAVFEAGMRVHGLVVLVRYNPRSKLLARAHRCADGLAEPIWLWVAPDHRRLQLPGQDGWIRMGA